MKFYKTALVTLLICLLLASPVLASSTGPSAPGTTDALSGVTIEYTREQFISWLAEVKGIDLLSAEAQVMAAEQTRSSNAMSDMMSDAQILSSISYHEFLSHSDFGLGTTIEAGVLYIIEYWGGPYKGIVGIAAQWTAPYSSGAYTWSQLYHVVDWNAQSITQMAHGTVTYAVDISVSGGAEFKNALLGAGFSVEVTIGTTVYLRKTQSWSAYINIFQY